MIKQCLMCGKEVETNINPSSFVYICDECSDKVRGHWQIVINRMGELYENYWFDKFIVKSGNIKAHTGCVRFANITELQPDDPSAIILTSKKPGNGKTHLGVSIIRQWLIANKPEVKWPFEKQNKAWCITSDSKILQEVRKTYNDDYYEDEDDVIARYAKYPILMIDDLGKYTPEKLNFTQRILFEIVNVRYIRRKPTIFTTNKSGSELDEYLGEYTFDRIRGMTKCRDKEGNWQHPVYEITEPSFR